MLLPLLAAALLGAAAPAGASPVDSCRGFRRSSATPIWLCEGGLELGWHETTDERAERHLQDGLDDVASVRARSRITFPVGAVKALALRFEQEDQHAWLSHFNAALPTKSGTRVFDCRVPSSEPKGPERCERIVRYLLEHGPGALPPEEPPRVGARKLAVPKGCKVTMNLRAEVNLTCEDGTLFIWSPLKEPKDEVMFEARIQNAWGSGAPFVDVACVVEGEAAKCRRGQFSARKEGGNVLVGYRTLEGTTFQAICWYGGAVDSVPPACAQVVKPGP
jgi:hypothetical protein